MNIFYKDNKIVERMKRGPLGPHIVAYYLVSGIDYTFGQEERGDQDCVLADVD